MAVAKVDLRKANEDEKPIVQGLHVFQIIDATFKPAKESEYQNCELVLLIQEGESAGKKHYERINLGPDSGWRWKALYRALELPMGDDLEVDTEDLIGKTLVGEVVHRPNPENEERPFVNIKKFTPYD